MVCNGSGACVCVTSAETPTFQHVTPLAVGRIHGQSEFFAEERRGRKAPQSCQVPPPAPGTSKGENDRLGQRIRVASGCHLCPAVAIEGVLGGLRSIAGVRKFAIQIAGVVVW